MSVTARGIYSGPVEALRSMLSNCTSMQKLLQAANAAAALSEIIAFGTPGDALRPFALVNIPESNRESSSQGRFLPAGKLTIAIEIPLEWTAPVTAQVSTTVFTLGALAGLADDCFNGQTLTVNDGAQTGQSAVILDFVGATGAVTLQTALPGLPGVGASCQIAPASVSDQMLAFMNILGDIQAELEALSGGGDCLSIHSIRLADYGRPMIESDEDEYAGALIEVEYGV